jgi:hypothetical protein
MLILPKEEHMRIRPKYKKKRGNKKGMEPQMDEEDKPFIGLEEVEKFKDVEIAFL